jgi:large subunit ribosomal protein L20
MARVTNKPASHKRRKKILKHAKGYRGSRKLLRLGKESVEKGWQYAYRDRKAKKREFRRLWIIRINAAAHQHGLNYNQFMHGLKALDVEINRKMLAELAVNNPNTFADLANSVKKKLNIK